MRRRDAVQWAQGILSLTLDVRVGARKAVLDLHLLVRMDS